MSETGRGASFPRQRGGWAVTIEQLTTDGVFTLDGQSFDVTNNVWLVGDHREGARDRCGT